MYIGISLELYNPFIHANILCFDSYKQITQEVDFNLYIQLQNSGGVMTQMGANVIGVIPGRNWGTPIDRPLIIGAHWDAVPNSPGYNDNGSGVSVLLEVASTLMRTKCFDNEHTLIFAVFDLEEPGCYGSLGNLYKIITPRRTGRPILV